MENVVAILNRERAAAMERLDVLTAEGRDLRQRVREIDNAVTLLSGHTPIAKPTRSSGGTLQSLIWNCVSGYGQNGVTAKDVAASLTAGGRETSEPSASSTLSRMKNDGEVENRNGKWFAKTTEAPGAQAPEASKEMVPDDEGEAFAAPSRRPWSPDVQRPSAFDADLDDDVPF